MNYLMLLLQWHWSPTTYAKLAAKRSRTGPPSFVLLHGRLREPILFNDQL